MEAQVLRRLDRAYREYLHEKSKPPEPAPIAEQLRAVKELHDMGKKAKQ